MDLLFKDALLDTLAMLPWLIAIYILLEVIERRYEGIVKRSLSNSHKFGPLVGALLGAVPQCGFSVVATALYTHRTISLGTLLAVYLSTSDEAIPVILSQPSKIGVLFPLLLTKIVIGTLAGYLVDLILPARQSSLLHVHEDACACVEHSHFCGHEHSSKDGPLKAYILTPLRHALVIAAFILVIDIIFNFVLALPSAQSIEEIFFHGSFLQPLACALIGLVPNCAASVAITEVFLRGGVTFGSAVAGLCTSAGLGLLVLVRESNSFKETLKVVSLLLVIGLLSGTLINLIAK